MDAPRANSGGSGSALAKLKPSLPDTCGDTCQCPVDLKETSALGIARAKLALAVLYLNSIEARDRLCGVIQHGSKFLSNGEPGIAHNVDTTTSLARKVFRLFKFLNGVHALVSPTPQGTPPLLHFIGQALLTAYLFLDQIVWLHRTDIYKNKECAELIDRISVYCWMFSSMCTILVAVGWNEQESNEGTLDWLAPLIAALDVVVAVGLLQLAPMVTPRITGGFGLFSSLISCYQLLPPPTKQKSE